MTNSLRELRCWFSYCVLFATSMTIASISWVALGTPIASASTPRLVAKPATGLTKGKLVKVSGTGFKSHDQVFLVECLAVAKGQSQCDINTATPATIGAKGVLSPTIFRVVTGKVGNGTCGTTATNLKKCVINAGNASGKDTASVRIVFKASKK
jgi:hypothetical protein